MRTIFLCPERDAHNVKREQIYHYPGIGPRSVSGVQTAMKTQLELNTLAQMTPVAGFSTSLPTIVAIVNSSYRRLSHSVKASERYLSHVGIVK